eukprot:6200799-Pleurochrysis_carterae.AAC.1
MNRAIPFVHTGSPSPPEAHCHALPSPASSRPDAYDGTHQSGSLPIQLSATSQASFALASKLCSCPLSQPSQPLPPRSLLFHYLPSFPPPSFAPLSHRQVEARNAFEGYVYSLRTSVAEDRVQSAMSEDDKTAMNTAIDDALKWLDDNQVARARDMYPLLARIVSGTYHSPSCT